MQQWTRDWMHKLQQICAQLAILHVKTVKVVKSLVAQAALHNIIKNKMREEKI